MRFAFLILAFSSLFPAPAGLNANEKPNIIVIYTDDHGWPDIGAAGIYDDLKTPHINALAASGVRATNGYSTAPQCIPSRAGLLSGRAQNRFGVESNGESMEGFDAQLTIADRLKKAGYATGQIGKWHLGPNNQITDHGFDDVYSKNANRPCFANYNLDGETIEMQMVDDNKYHLDACSDAALAFIKRHADESFFLYLAYRAPHVPLDAPKKYLDRFPGKMPERRRQALAMISAMDDGVGAIVGDLEKRGLAENTLIFYIGDNGAPLKIHMDDAPGGGPGWDGSLNKPMNGEKGMLSEGGIRVPFLVSWPGTIPENQVYDHPVTTLDLAATAVSIAGLPMDDKLDGVNLTPYLSGEKTEAPHESLTWRWIAQAAIREGNWKLLIGGKREYLFDLKTDPEETKNYLSEKPEIVGQLRKKLSAWAEDLDPPGINTKGMSETWERYFDFYLDGKPAPEREKPTTNFQGWLPRNSSGELKTGQLLITPTAAAKRQRHFLAQSGVEMNGPFTAKIEISCGDGNIAVSWRSKGQKDFVAGQTISTKVKAVPDWQEVELEIPAEGESIHLRLHLPGGKVGLRSIELTGADKKQTWSFTR